MLTNSVPDELTVTEFTLRLPPSMSKSMFPQSSARVSVIPPSTSKVPALISKRTTPTSLAAVLAEILKSPATLNKQVDPFRKKRIPFESKLSMVITKSSATLKLAVAAPPSFSLKSMSSPPSLSASTSSPTSILPESSISIIKSSPVF